MVYYFTTRCGNYTIYMGKDKYENEDLIKYGHPEDCWFHVDDLSSAHVYLRLKPDMTLDDIPDDCLIDCCSLVKANSIQGCKKSFVYVVYTRWKNLKKVSFCGCIVVGLVFSVFAAVSSVKNVIIFKLSHASATM